MIPVHSLKKEGVALVTLNTDFYDMYPVTEVCERFKELAKLRVVFSRDKKQIEVWIKPKGGEDADALALEFSNHVLHFQVKGV